MIIAELLIKYLELLEYIQVIVCMTGGSNKPSLARYIFACLFARCGKNNKSCKYYTTRTLTGTQRDDTAFPVFTFAPLQRCNEYSEFTTLQQYITSKTKNTEQYMDCLLYTSPFMETFNVRLHKQSTRVCLYVRYYYYCETI